MKKFSDLYETPEQAERKRERLAQSRIRLEQQALHLKIQQEKTRLLEEKRRKEENEKKVRTLKRIFSLYYIKKGAKAAAALVGAAASVVAALRVLAYMNPDARELYFALSNKLNALVSAVIQGTPGKFEKLKALIQEIGSAIKLPFQLLARKFKHKQDSGSEVMNSKYSALQKVIGRRYSNRLLKDSIIERFSSLNKNLKSSKMRRDSKRAALMILDDEFGFENIGPQASTDKYGFETIGPKSLPNQGNSKVLKAGAAALLILTPILANLIRLKMKYGSAFQPIVDFVKAQINKIKSGAFKGRIVEIKNKIKSMLQRPLSRDEIQRDPNAKQIVVTVSRMSDSAIKVVSNKVEMIVDNKANQLIRRYDRKHNDLLGAAMFATAFKTLIIPLLLGLLKAGAIAGIAGSLKENILNPLLRRLIGYGKSLVANKTADNTYTDAIISKIKADMTKLLAVLKREGSSIYSRLAAPFNKIKSLA